MEFKGINTTYNSNPIAQILVESPGSSIIDLFLSKDFVDAKVMDRFKGNNEYLLSFAGKTLRLFSETKLLPGEFLKLKAHNAGPQIQLEILNRSFYSDVSHSDIEPAWTKGYFSPSKTIFNALEPNQSDVSIQKLVQFLNVFFPCIEWNENVSYFDWHFQDREASGFLGKKEELFGFYFHYESDRAGSVDSCLNWKKEDFSDLVLQCTFHKLKTYFLANEKYQEFKKMLYSNSILTNNIIFHYSSGFREIRDWVA